ncbi:MAG TPA: hypothetical protein VHD83_22665 [Puia sp.]|nr:hypothetical protein [Puia sp.]
MKKISAMFLLGALCFTACKKSNSSTPTTDATFTATVNGKETTFNIFQATLIRSTDTHEKRMDIGGISTDNTKRVIITLGIETDQGNGMTVKPYVLNPFPEDDPGTPDVDESMTTQGFSTYSTSLGNNSWLTDVYNEDGLFTISACDSAHTTVSGTFQTTLKDFNTDTTVLSLTNGKMTNVKYMVLN